jgi:hypothetical protein
MSTTMNLDHESGARPIEEICNLPSEERKTRIVGFRRELLPLVKNRRAFANGMNLDFEYSEGLEGKLEELITFERVCCSDLKWELSRPQENELSLTVSGILPNSPMFETIEDEDIPLRSNSGFSMQLAQSLGLGTTAALILCCVAPMALAAVAGVAIAAPLARLDDPLMIAAGSLALTIPAWFWLRRRAARSSCGC